MPAAQTQPSGQPAASPPSPAEGTDDVTDTFPPLSCSASAEPDALQHPALRQSALERHGQTDADARPNALAAPMDAAALHFSQQEEALLAAPVALQSAAREEESGRAAGKSSTAESASTATDTVAPPLQTLADTNVQLRQGSPPAPPVVLVPGDKAAAGQNSAAEEHLPPASSSAAFAASWARVPLSQAPVSATRAVPSQGSVVGPGPGAPPVAAAAAQLPPQPAEAGACKSERGGPPGESGEERAAFYESLRRHWQQEAKDDFVNNRCASSFAPAWLLFRRMHACCVFEICHSRSCMPLF